MILLFVIAGVIYYVLISKVLVHEVDEALYRYEEQVENYVAKHDSLPVFKNFEEVKVKYKVTKNLTPRLIRTVYLYNADDRKSDNFRQIIFTQKVGNRIYRISVAKPLEGTQLLITSIAFSTLVILLLIIVVSVLLNYLVLRKLWKPFYNSMKEMKRFKLGSNTQLHLPPSDIDEFSLMNHNLSQAVNSARDDYRILKEFTENASHETQTPLAIIRSKLDLVIQDEGLSEEQSDALNSAYEAVSRLSKLNQSLLLLAKIENQQFKSVEAVNLQERIEEKLQQFNEFWSGNEICIKSKLSPACIQANPELIDILLNNLLSNAGRHNVEGGVISLKLVPGRLEIANTGKSGKLDTAKLFSRFYKEAQHSKHNGLGLSIVKQICERSDIVISYCYNENQHCFCLVWKS
jgi:signal transduction histidine kinase